MARESKPNHPAPGFRNHGEGVARSIGNVGYSWSSPASSTLGMSLGFGTTWLYPNYVGNSAFGFQLRCLSE